MLHIVNAPIKSPIRKFFVIILNLVKIIKQIVTTENVILLFIVFELNVITSIEAKTAQKRDEINEDKIGDPSFTEY